MQSFDFIHRANADYVERVYQQYRADPNSVDTPWQAFFAGFELGSGQQPGTVFSTGDGANDGAAVRLSLEVADLVHAYRELGHFEATLDPLGHHRPPHPLLQLKEFGISAADLDRQVGCDGFLGQCDGTLRDLIDKLRTTYCGNIGIEYMDISDKAQREWLAQRMEPILNRPKFSPEESRAIFYELVATQGFEEFLQTKYLSQKRFSLEGAESLVTLLNTLVNDGATLGVEEMVMGMAHRGRLNVLAHVLNKPYEMILSEFEDKAAMLPHEYAGDGDVKYHLGYSQDRVTASGRTVHLALSFNPSHLELVNPVVEGIVRAKQYTKGDNDRTRVVPILMHGDAAFCGQGIVMETLALSEMPYWRTGGTIHIIINNQIGFTTMPKQGRFTPYPTDIAKTIQAPIFHVNADDPEAVVHAARLAIAFRQKFHCDVMIDLWCYRRQGHNEQDEPTFTQPLMYKQISAHTRVRELYAKRLIDDGKMTPDDIDRMKIAARERMDRAQTVAREAKPKHALTSFGGLWQGMQRAGNDWSAKTAVPADLLRRVGEGASKIPPGFTLHKKLERLVQARHDMALGKAPIDWGGAEMLALGSLVLEGTPIRFVGQDAQRGTFSHRHACLHDFETGEKYYPLANISPDQAPVIIVNTMLSELAVLGFEYGFSSADPRNLVVWEAQFGDFVNGAQPIIDQFIAGGESKWQKMCGLTMLLPHGYEGAGPEHSYAYLDRFLALCADNNLQVCVPTMPAQYFHLLRRQVLRKFRKPLITMTPKSLLREAMATSSLEDLTQGTFQTVMDDPANPPRERVRRVLLCSGKIYFTLHVNREKFKVRDVAIVRVEQLYPFPQREIQTILAKYRDAQEICWVQEEPRNKGAWTFTEPRLRQLLPDGRVLTYYGRDEAASSAVGSKRLHEIEEQELVSHALDLRTPVSTGGNGAARPAVDEPPPTSQRTLAQPQETQKATS